MIYTRFFIYDQKEAVIVNVTTFYLLHVFFSSPWDAHMCSKKCNFIEILFNIFCHCAHSYTSIRLYFLLIKKKFFIRKKQVEQMLTLAKWRRVWIVSILSWNILRFISQPFNLIFKKKKMYKENKFVLSIFSFPSIFNLYVLSPHHSN